MNVRMMNATNAKFNQPRTGLYLRDSTYTGGGAVQLSVGKIPCGWHTILLFSMDWIGSTQPTVLGPADGVGNHRPYVQLFCGHSPTTCQAKGATHPNQVEAAVAAQSSILQELLQNPPGSVFGLDLSLECHYNIDYCDQYIHICIWVDLVKYLAITFLHLPIQSKFSWMCSRSMAKLTSSMDMLFW